MKPKKQNCHTRRPWTVMLALAFVEQSAWAVKNAWFNTIVFDPITPDHLPVP